MKRPVIGITTRHADPTWIALYTQRYVDAIEAAGGTPVVLAPETDTPAAIDGLDGLLLSGGGDLDPREYGEPLAGSEPPEINPARDALDLGLARAALARDLPVFGICRGLQVLNVVFGGTLVQDAPGHRGEYIAPERRADTPQRLAITPETRLGGLLGLEETVVNSFHHQVVTPACVGSGLVVSARHTGGDEVVEALESSRHRWVVGVQWHPERYAIDSAVFSDPEAQRRLFEEFVRVARGES